MKIKGNQAFPAADKHSDSNHYQSGAEPQLKTEGIAHPFIVSAAVKLGAEYSRSRYGAENTDIKDKQQLVRHSYAGHLLRSYLSYHDVVQKPHKIGDSVLYHNRYGHRQHQLIKILCSD